MKIGPSKNRASTRLMPRGTQKYNDKHVTNKMDHKNCHHAITALTGKKIMPIKADGIARCPDHFCSVPKSLLFMETRTKGIVGLIYVTDKG